MKLIRPRAILRLAAALPLARTKKSGMVSSKSNPLLITAALAALIVANLAVTSGLLWIIQEWKPASGSRFLQNQLNQVWFGTLLSQVVLIGCWLGLGDGRWYVRLVAAIALTLATALAFHFGVVLSPTARRSADEEPWAIIGFILIAMMLAVSLVGFVLRRMRGWRLTWRASVQQLTIHQFQIADGLLWMVVIGGALAAMRFVVSIEEDFREQLVRISLLTARGAAIVLVAMVTAFSTARPMRNVIVLVSVVVAIGIAFAIPDVYRDLQSTWARVTGPIAWNVYLSNAINAGFGQIVLMLAVMSGALVNCLALRLTGCQLIRPGQGTSSSLSEAKQD